MSQTHTTPYMHFDTKKTLLKVYFDAFRMIMTLLVVIWGTLINSYLVLHHGCSSCDSFIAPVNHVAHYVLLINIALLIPCAILWVNWRALLFLAPGVVFFVLWFGGNSLPLGTPEVEGVEITVATFNVFGHQANPYQTFSVIATLHADIIGLQEMHPFLARKMRRDLIEDYPYQAARTLTEFDEFVLLSRYPITEINYYPVGVDPVTDLYVPNYMRAVVTVHDQPIIIYVFHPPNPNFNRVVGFDDSALETEVEAMMRIVERFDYPTLVLCDCNSTPRSRQYRLMNEVLDNAFGEAGSGFGLTFPATRPIIRIDHIWFSRHFTAIDAEVWKTSGTSDHRPVRATLDFRP